MYAIVRIAGKQVRVDKGLSLKVPKLDLAEGSTHQFEEVMLIARDGNTQIGQPLISGAKVEATVLKHGKGEKVFIYKMKRRKNYRRRAGHRQEYTEIKIEDIIGN